MHQARQTVGTYVQTRSKRPERTAKGRPVLALAETNAQLEKLDAEGRVPGRWIICPVNMYFLPASAFSGGELASGESDSPGHSGDPHHTGYLFPETYRFIDELTDKLNST